jgi:hypothetical protein
MGWFKPSPMTLEYGEPAHQMVARAFLHNAIRFGGDILVDAKYHFVGPHGIEYRGTDEIWKRNTKTVAQGVAQLCEEIQQDFNERIAAMSKAREYARDQLAVPPLFASAAD